MVYPPRYTGKQTLRLIPFSSLILIPKEITLFGFNFEMLLSIYSSLTSLLNPHEQYTLAYKLKQPCSTEKRH